MKKSAEAIKRTQNSDKNFRLAIFLIDLNQFCESWKCVINSSYMNNLKEINESVGGNKKHGEQVIKTF